MNRILKDYKILVVGENCIDRFIYGRVEDRKCPEAPAFILNPSFSSENPGMAANTHHNVKSLKINCDLISNKEKIIKERFIDESLNYLLLRVDHNQGSIHRVNRADLHKDKLSKYDAIIVSDYNKGFLKKSDIQHICENHPLTFVDTKKRLGEFCLNATYININEAEYNKSFPFISDKLFHEKLIITLGPKGCRYQGHIYPVEKTEVIDQVGAGDTFVSALAVEFLKSSNIIKAIEFANYCATQLVKKKGVSTPG